MNLGHDDDDMCDDCAQAAMMGMKPACCDDVAVEIEIFDEDTCDMCGMPMQDNLCDCCAGAMSMSPGKVDVVHHGMNESFEFDKFMDNILVKESSSRSLARGDSPIRERARRHQERPINRTRYGVIK